MLIASSTEYPFFWSTSKISGGGWIKLFVPRILLDYIILINTKVYTGSLYQTTIRP
jgi:hypothetical protein